ncbi:metallophosphoesterase [Bacillus sp. BRMEA1]|uniref:metallophosphoesterase n=1 Tax=Neobacillus endophyticus TaxID=2738405 RepID=UPI001567C3C9|nr:metallophosphoesterase [Neobacillus endophyticus]NRD77262.1 metallophosphoesterase [Neobacillus endophyticus]
MKKLIVIFLVAVSFQLFQKHVWAAETNTSSPEPNLQVPIISDVHINENLPVRQEHFTNALQDYLQIAPHYQAIVVDGDLTDYGTETQYEIFKRIFDANTVPDAAKLLVMGNHEFYKGTYANSQNSDQMLIDRFVTETGADGLYYDKWIKGSNQENYHFIVLSSEVSSATAPEDYTVLSDQQYQWLENTLKQDANPNKPIFVFIHEPIANTVYGSEEWGSQLLTGRLKSILQQYPQAILFTGHLHYLLNHPRSVYQDGFTMVSTGAVAYMLYEGGNAPMEFSQGLLVNVYDDHVEIKAREFSNHSWVNQYSIPIPFRKTIDDTEKPSFPADAQATVTGVTATTASISWPAATDNTMVDKYVIKQNGKVLQTVYNKYWESPSASPYTANLSNLSANTNYSLEISAVDAWNNESANSIFVGLKTDLSKGWVKAGTIYFYYDERTGQKVTGWLLDKDKWYYFNKYGMMQTGWVNVNGKWYLLGTDGAMKTGWAKDNGSWYYLDQNGAMKIGWVIVGQRWYFLKSSGAMQSGWLHDSGSSYYLNSSGVMQTGWKLIVNKWYYFYSSGKMAVNTKIGNCKIGSDGVWIR